MSSAPDARESLVAALTADLVGPFDLSPDAHEEHLTVPPSRWYLTGFLAPQSDRETNDPTSDDDSRGAEDDDDEEAPSTEPEPKQKNHFPASIGLSVLLPPAIEGQRDSVTASVSFADYLRHEEAIADKKQKKVTWRRVAHPPQSVTIGLDSEALAAGVFVQDTIGVRICGKLEVADAPGLALGTRALSLFVVNERAPGEKGRVDESYLFQVALEVHYPRGFAARPNRQGERSRELDDRTADLQFRDHYEWGVGHNVAVLAPAEGRPVTTLRTTWIPTSEVPRVVTHEEPGLTTAMDALADLPDGPSMVRTLTPIVEAYGAWIERQATIGMDSDLRAKTQNKLLHNARLAKDRIAVGIALLQSDSDARDAFRWMNRAMATAARKRSPSRYPAGTSPSWRLFQLAFVLLSLPGIADETHPDRAVVELIFFPTGGGKTEAYLGLIGFTLLLRRLRGAARLDRGLGVAVLLRYTLRLLTLDQLGRAATLICALELLRQSDPARLGEVRFAVGLWVGRSATANTMEQVKKLIIEYKKLAGKKRGVAVSAEQLPLVRLRARSRQLGVKARAVLARRSARGVRVRAG